MKYFEKNINYIWSLRIIFVRYIVSGVLAAFFGFLSLYFLTDILNIWYILSSIISFTITFFVSFFLQKLWTFQNDNFDIIYQQLTKSLIYAFLNLIFNTIFMYLLVDIFNIYYMTAQFICYAFFAFTGFFVYNQFIFNK